MSEAEVDGFLSTIKLPEPAVEWLREGQYEDADELKTAVVTAQTRVKALTKSGKVFGQGAGEGEGGDKDDMTVKEYDASYADIAEKYNLTRPAGEEEEDTDE